LLAHDKIKGKNMRQLSAARSANYFDTQKLEPFDGLGFAIQDITSASAQSIGDWVEWLVRPTTMTATDYVEAVLSTGCAIEFDQAVMRAAMHWLQFQSPTTRLSVNVFPQSISNSSFTRFVDELLLVSDIHPSQFCFEITVHHAIDNLIAATGFAKHVRDMGASVALDDLGGGNMHVGLLAPLQLVDFVKIDRSWVIPALESDKHKETLDALVKFARRMGVRLVLEGIETADHLQLVVEYGADYYQGYIDGEPRIVENMEDTHSKGLTEAI
jgi:EAL domain-containing protein (putative c-di-GMP-specific phosphodiesterase class I)